MGYGASKEVQSESTVKIPTAGILAGVVLDSIALNEAADRLEFSFKQSNGATVKHIEFEAKENPYNTIEEQQDLTNRKVKHIATKFMDEDAFIISSVDSFEAYAKAVIKLLTGKFEGKTVNVLFTYNKKGYVGLPKYPNFIEKGTVALADTALVIGTKDVITKTVVVPDTPEVEVAAAPLNDLPF